MINNSASSGRKVFLVHGGVETKDREEIRSITEDEDNAIIVASYGTFSTGINIKRLHNIIFASPSKSRVRNLQSIGRVLERVKIRMKQYYMILQMMYQIMVRTPITLFIIYLKE